VPAPRQPSEGKRGYEGVMRLSAVYAKMVQCCST